MTINTFESFDPLKVKQTANTEAQANALKREIRNILNSYVGWYDPFCEVIQNAIDSAEKRSRNNDNDYQPSVWVTINIKDNYLVVTDNGVGLTQQQLEQFLAPYFSFKSGETRGKKGAGATYLAYGFNYIQVCTKTEHYNAIGKMVDARNWVDDDNPAANPTVIPDQSGPIDERFNEVDSGVSVCIKFEKKTFPSDLRWIQTSDANSWMKILQVKTAVGAIFKNDSINIFVKVVDREGKVTQDNITRIEYLWTHLIAGRSASVEEIVSKRTELFNKEKDPDKLPSYLQNLEVIYDSWDCNKLAAELNLEAEDLEICDKYKPFVYGGYVWSTREGERFNTSINLRSKTKVLYGGIQISANNMPQGELIQIPLNRNIGRQNNAHVVIHFSNYEPDLGRKGFKHEIVDFSKTVAAKIVNLLFKYHKFLKPTTGVQANLLRQESIEDWKTELVAYEKKNPLILFNNNFFLPTNSISITSLPAREQDVIALFNQLIAGGVIRGVKIMSTNERFTYDGLYRVIIDKPAEHHIYNIISNPLGIIEEIVLNYDQKLPFTSSPKVLEYKYSLDALIEDVESGIKNSNDIGLVIVWKTGDLWKEHYKLTSLLDVNNLTLRQYHGVTHTITNLNTGQFEMDLIVLEELIDYLNDPEKSQFEQTQKYEDD